MVFGDSLKLKYFCLLLSILDSAVTKGLHKNDWAEAPYPALLIFSLDHLLTSKKL